MDRKNFFLGIACLAGAFALFFLTKPPTPVAAIPPAVTQVAATKALPTMSAVPSSATRVDSLAIDKSKAEYPFIENDLIKVTLTTRGGAVHKIELKKEFSEVGKNEPIAFNVGNEDAALALAHRDSNAGSLVGVYSVFSVRSKTATAVTLVGSLSDGSRVERTYSVATPKVGEVGESYSLRFSTRVIPVAGKSAPSVWISTGCWMPTAGDTSNQFLSVLAYDGDDLTRIGLDKFTAASGFLGLGKHDAAISSPIASVAKPLTWVASGNQFFASILHPDAAVRGTRTEVIVLPVSFDPLKRSLQAFASWETPADKDGVRTMEGDFFVGPKEYARVAALPDSQVYVLQFSKLLGFISFGGICKLLLFVLGAVHLLLAWSGAWSWGWAIVLLTCLLKLITWPLTSMQMKAAKKMQKFAKPMQDIREKYKDNPEKLQKETMKLYKDNQINPLAGCLPILIQMPIFFGLYTAFQTTVELRLHSFLWIADLSAPDTVYTIGGVGGFPVNILPILMGLSMWQSMRMTPNPSADGSQKTIFLMMTLMFPVICYPMPAALTLYMTIQNLLTILQTWLTKDEDARIKDEDVEVILPTTTRRKPKG